jgi:hypothetical protein
VASIAILAARTATAGRERAAWAALTVALATWMSGSLWEAVAGRPIGAGAGGPENAM